MFEEVIVGLDGSALAEQAIPVARSLAPGRLIFLRIVEDPAEIAAEEEHLRENARRHGAQLRIVVAANVPAAIVAELAREPGATAVLTTHGRNAWGEAILGSVALGVLRQAQRPVVLCRPGGREWNLHDRVRTVAAALDGSGFAEKILPHAVRAAQWLEARLLLLQTLPAQHPAAGAGLDVVESSYLHRKADEIEARHGLRPDWEVLHGAAGPAICRFIQDMPGTLLAMTTHSRPPAERAIMGSVAGHCIRHSGAPMLVYGRVERPG